jgi:hypothetical protein
MTILCNVLILLYLKSILSIDCNPDEVHISIGDAYTEQNFERESIIISFGTKVFFFDCIFN